MIKKIKITAAALVAVGIVVFLYMASELTKLAESDILDISSNEDEEEWF